MLRVGKNIIYIICKNKIHERERNSWTHKFAILYEMLEIRVSRYV